MSDVTLLPCPFCGETPLPTVLGEGERYLVLCDRCGVRTAYVRGQPEAAAAAWNARPAPALTPKQAAADEMFEALNLITMTPGVVLPKRLVDMALSALAKAGQP